MARALVLEPQVLLFDEPLSNLDAKLRRHVREEIREIQQKLGLTVVYVTHDQEEALAVSDRIIVMNNAVIAQDGTPRELYDAPANAFVADFIGEANIFDCEIAGIENGIASVRLGELTLSLPARDFRARPGQARRAAEPHHAPSGRNAEHASRRRWRRRPMSAATSNSSSVRNSARSSWCHRTSMRPSSPASRSALAFPRAGRFSFALKAYFSP